LAANTPWDNWQDYNFVPLSHITATCTLRRKRFVGLRWYRDEVTLYKDAPRTLRRRPGGCQIYTYSSGTLTIDCRRSSTSGSATWSFRLRPTDGRSTGTAYFDTSRSTMGPHRISVWRFGRYVNVTETVSPGTMITYSLVELSFLRRYSKRVWRNERRTLTAHWPSL
jgi:hypothetical protein